MQNQTNSWNWLYEKIQSANQNMSRLRSTFQLEKEVEKRLEFR